MSKFLDYGGLQTYNAKVKTKIEGVANDLSAFISQTQADIANNYAKKNELRIFAITEDIVTVTTDATKGVSPYSTSYGYTNIEIDKNAGISWEEGGLYTFTINTKMVVASATRNVRIRIGGENDGDTWHPIMNESNTILAGSSYFIKTVTRFFQYKSTYISNGALHIGSDNNSTYAYLVNSFGAGAIKIDDNGFGAKSSLLFPTTPITNKDERYSSLVKTSSTGTTKQFFENLTFYIDRPPFYNYGNDTSAGQATVGTTYETYTASDLRYNANTNSSFVTALKKAYLILENFNPENMTFKPHISIGGIFTIDKLITKLPSTIEGDVYLYYLGTTGSSWYSLTPNRTQKDVIYKYTPSTGNLELVKFKAKDSDKLNGQEATYYLNYNNFSNTPSSLPASDVPSWAKQANKPTYTASEVGADSAGSASAVQDNLDDFIINTYGVKMQTIDGLLDDFAIDLDDKVSSGQFNTLSQTVSEKQDKITATNKLSYSLISGTPSSLPASDVYSWAKASTKPTYTASEVGADPSGSASAVQSNLTSYQSQVSADMTTLSVLANSKSTVSASSTGTSTTEVKYITIDGTQYKLPSGGGTIPTITLNGSATTTPTFYAPTASGTANLILKSNGANAAPTYVPYYGLSYGVGSPTTMDLNSSSKTGTGSIHYIAKTADYKYARVKFMVRTYYNGTGYWNLYIQKNESATSISTTPSTVCIGTNATPSSSSYMIITGSYSRAHEVYLDAIVNISNATGTSPYVTFRCGFQTNASSTTTEIRYLGYEKFN